MGVTRGLGARGPGGHPNFPFCLLEYVAIETEVTLNFIECTHGELILVK